MKFKIIFFYTTALHIAILNGEAEIAKLLLANKNLNINAMRILSQTLFIKLLINFLYHFKFSFFITFKTNVLITF